MRVVASALCGLVVFTTMTWAAPPVDLGVQRAEVVATGPSRLVVRGHGQSGTELVGVDTERGAVAWRVPLESERVEVVHVGDHLVLLGSPPQAIVLASGQRGQVERAAGRAVVAGGALLATDGREVRRVSFTGEVTWTWASGGSVLEVTGAGEGGAAVLLGDAVVRLDPAGAVAWRTELALPADAARRAKLATAGGWVVVIAGRELRAFGLEDGAARDPLELVPDESKAKITFELKHAPLAVGGETLVLQGVHGRATKDGSSYRGEPMCLLVDLGRLKVTARLDAHELLAAGPDAVVIEVWRMTRTREEGIPVPDVGSAAYSPDRGKRLWELDHVPTGVTSTHFAVPMISQPKPPWGLSIRDVRRGRQAAFLPVPDEHVRAAAERLRAGDLGAIGGFRAGALHAGAGFWVRSGTLLRAVRTEALRATVELQLPESTAAITGVVLDEAGVLSVVSEDGSFNGSGRR